MDWRREGEMMEQILSLLVALAGLADRAAGLPLCLQLPVFAFLARGEDVARCFVGGLPSGMPALVTASQAADRAERLAADFRSLARLLRGLLARARRLARLSARVARPSMPTRVLAADAPRPVPALPAPDTS